ncbi:MAG: nucleotide exchange factor GrpE [Firmicutes bacterium]|nr:nucleotide exchange factor GrpE [Bacillota bacterium]
MKKEAKQEVEQKTETPAPTEMEQALTEENEKLIAENEKLTEENKKLNQTCKRLQSSADKSDTYLNQLVAMKNDFESYKRRMKFNGEQAKNEGVQSVVVKLISVIDTFEIAAKHLDGDNLKAFMMVQSQFIQILNEFGVKEMDVEGKPFDPLKMNALSKMDYGEDKKDLVVEVYKKGYETEDKVLRYAEVIVGA